MKKLSKLLLSAGLSVLAASMMLTGCGGDDGQNSSSAVSSMADTSSTSSYMGHGLDADGKGQLSADDLLGGWMYDGHGCLMNFKADGTCAVNYEGQDYNCKYACKDNKVTLTCGDKTAVGELRDDNKLYFNNSKAGFAKDEHANGPAPTPVPSPSGNGGSANTSANAELAGEWLYSGQGCILNFKENGTCKVSYEGKDYDCRFEYAGGKVSLIHSSRTAVGELASNGQIYFDGSSSGFMRRSDSMFNGDAPFVPKAEDFLGTWVCNGDKCVFTVMDDGTCMLQDKAGHVNGGSIWHDVDAYMELALDDGRILRVDMRDAQTVTVDGYSGYFNKE